MSQDENRGKPPSSNLIETLLVEATSHLRIGLEGRGDGAVIIRAIIETVAVTAAIVECDIVQRGRQSIGLLDAGIYAVGEVGGGGVENAVTEWSSTIAIGRAHFGETPKIATLRAVRGHRSERHRGGGRECRSGGSNCGRALCDRRR